MQTITITKLRKFVQTRNKSGHSSNMQFGIDADACGFAVADLGDVEKFNIDGFTAYRWKITTKEGPTVALIEFGRSIYLDCDRDKDTLSMMRLMEKAVPVPLAD